jgi:hypothetical protein
MLAQPDNGLSAFAWMISVVGFVITFLWCYPPSSEGLNCGLNITNTRWIDLSGGIHNEHVSRAANCSRRFGDDFKPQLRPSQGDRPG